ncbi:MAG: hypothetical protein ACW991_01485, partial [Candidatus Hodarchaeales archaeon]
MPAGQATAHFFRILYVIVFVFSCILIIGIPIPIDNPILATSIDPTMFDFAQAFNILEYVMLIVQELIRALAGVALTLVATIASAKKGILFIGDENFGGVALGDMQTALAAIVNPANGFFPHSGVTNIATFLEDFGNFFGATTILILLPVALLSGVGFLREGDTKLAIYSFLGFQLIIIIAIFTEKIIVNTEIDSSNLLTMIFSPIFALGFLLYLLLEVAFQTSYTLNIIEPMTEREKRIQEHLKRIRSFVPLSEE